MADAHATLNALSFMYIAFAHATDGELAPEEMRTLAAHIKEWQPDASLERVGEVLQEAMTRYQTVDAEERIVEIRRRAEALKADFDTNDRLMILQDLEAISKADGKVTQGEREFLAAMRQLLELD